MNSAIANRDELSQQMWRRNGERKQARATSLEHAVMGGRKQAQEETSGSQVDSGRNGKQLKALL